jgi:hypothetical protein
MDALVGELDRLGRTSQTAATMAVASTMRAAAAEVVKPPAAPASKRSRRGLILGGLGAVALVGAGAVTTFALRSGHHRAPSFHAPIDVKLSTMAGPGVKASDFTLKEIDLKTPVSEAATTATPFSKGGDSAAIAVLVEGSARFGGFLEQAKAAVTELGKFGPAQTHRTLIVYGATVVEKRAMDGAPFAAVDLGKDADLQAKASDLKSGLLVAASALSRDVADRKILVVIGTGGAMDANEDLAEPRKLLAGADIEVYAIYASPDQDQKEVGRLRRLATSQRVFVAGNGDMNLQVQALEDRLDGNFVVEFDGAPFAFDGKQHDFTIALHGIESDPADVQLPKLTKRPPAGTRVEISTSIGNP